jgi:hypothetical protein
METQLASQLEQDLESAVDSNARSDSQALETQSQPPVTRKRKREVDGFVTPTNKERRRSSRFSFHKDDPIFDDPEALISSRSGRSKKQLLSTTDDQALASPVEPNPKKRRRQLKGDITEVEELHSANAEQQMAPSPAKGSSKKRRQSKGTPKTTKEAKSTNNQKDIGEGQTTSQNTELSSQQQKPSESSDARPTGEGQASHQSSAISSSQKRRSSRLSSQAAPVSTDELSAPTKPTSSRSRKQNAREQELLPAADAAGDTRTPSQDDQLGDKKASTEQPMEKPTALSLSQPRGQSTPRSEDILMQDADAVIDATLVLAIEAEKQTEKQTNTPMDELSEGTKKQSSKQIGSLISQTTNLPEEQATPNNLGIIASLQKILDDAKSATLDRSALKQIDDLLFDIRVEAHEALRRNTG